MCGKGESQKYREKTEDCGVLRHRLHLCIVIPAKRQVTMAGTQLLPYSGRDEREGHLLFMSKACRSNTVPAAKVHGSSSQPCNLEGQNHYLREKLAGKNKAACSSGLSCSRHSRASYTSFDPGITGAVPKDAWRHGKLKGQPPKERPTPSGTRGPGNSAPAGFGLSTPDFGAVLKAFSAFKTRQFQ
jgi:hypothetical protein